MARVTNAAITYNDANYMIANEGFTLIGTYKTGLECMSRSEIESYINADASNFSGYASNRLVPYNLLLVASVPDTEAPSVPTNLSLVDGGGSYILLWDASTDNVAVAYYRIYTDGTLLLDNQSWAEYGVTISEGDGHEFADVTVTAVDTSGNESGHSISVTATQPDVTPPSIPTSLSATAGTGVNELTWNPSTDNVEVSHYEVWRGTSTSNQFLLGTTAWDEVPFGYYDYSYVQATRHYYKIRAVDFSGNKSDFTASVNVRNMTAPM